MESVYPGEVVHWINDKLCCSLNNEFFEKFNPATGKLLAKVARGQWFEVNTALNAAEVARHNWADTNVVRRAEILKSAIGIIKKRKEDFIEIISLEAGRSKKSAQGEVEAAIKCGEFFVAEAQRFSGETFTSSNDNRLVFRVRMPRGICALFTPFNNPLASVAWKVFPALLCGNTAVLKAHELTPYTPVFFGQILERAGLPSGVFSVIQGLGDEAGTPLINDLRIDAISFTGSDATAKLIETAAAKRKDKFCKVSIESGGKNVLVVCDDADLDLAVECAVSSAFVDAGQRCASASRIIVFEKAYDEFVKKFVGRASLLKMGVGDEDDLGPVISKNQKNKINNLVNKTLHFPGARLYEGGYFADQTSRFMGLAFHEGCYVRPTIFENIPMDHEISQTEIFGPVTCLYKAKDFEEAVRLSNNSRYGLSGAIHTQNINRAMEFGRRYKAGVVRVNGPTYGSEPHMPFGGIGLSGNGTREPGKDALDFYSEWKVISIDHDPKEV